MQKYFVYFVYINCSEGVKALAKNARPFQSYQDQICNWIAVRFYETGCISIHRKIPMRINKELASVHCHKPKS